MSYLQNLPTIKNEHWKYTNLARFYKKELPPFETQSGAAELTTDNVLKLTGAPKNFDLENKDLHIRVATEKEINEFKNLKGYFSGHYAAKNINAETCFITIEQLSSNPSLRIQHDFSGDFKFEVVVIYKNIKDLKVFHKITGNSAAHIFLHQWVDLKANNHFEQVLWQDLGDQNNIHLEGHAEADENAHYSQVVITKGAALSRNNTAVKLTGKNAEADVHGLYLPKGKSHHDTYSYIEHAAPHSFSKQLYKGILDDESKGIFAGKVKVNKDCLLVDAQQLNKNLLLSPKAQGFSRPQMEIDTDDVKCAHGSTTGQLSEQELFYFESRGIRKEVARKMLAQGFANDVLLKIKNKKLYEWALKEGL